MFIIHGCCPIHIHNDYCGDVGRDQGLDPVWHHAAFVTVVTIYGTSAVTECGHTQNQSEMEWDFWVKWISNSINNYRI